MASVTTIPEFEDVDERPEPLAPREALEDTEMDITPMIDITFLLLIFFIVSSKMDQSTNVPLPPAQTGVAIPVRNSIIITVGPGDAADGPANVYKGDGIKPENAFDKGDMQAQEEEISAFVEDAMAEDPQKTYVLIKAAKGIKHREVARVQTAVSKPAAVQQLHVAVMEAQ
ncbi:MAG: biopolymer transporter ExbD [Planctomycetaceae bacterium]|jgi:biopolymer transport protein ExbD|nr:biopolymer transporter ExbD [Planctomycetaceae bacterium]